jgi:curved DNA-binding protein CbpA
VAGGADLYRILGVEPAADAAELARAYRRRLRQLHPDTQSGPPGGDPAGELEAVQHAYRLLRDPVHRSRYDEERRRAETLAAAGRDSVGVGTGIGTGRAGRERPVSIPVRRRVVPGRDWLLRVGPVRVQPLPPRVDPPQR